MSFAIECLLFCAAFTGMECFAWATHRWIMHGPLWIWHRSHHEPRKGLFELNDLFAVVFAAPAIVLIDLGVRHGHPWLLAIGLGITAYGAVYFLFHDGLVHKRFPLPIDPYSRFWVRRVQAHRLHHAVRTREGCVSFGFLWARPARELKSQMSGKT